MGSIDYTYDVLNRRVIREGDNQYEAYVYDGNQVVADLYYGDLLRTYVWGPGIDNLMSFTDYSTATPTTYYAVKDHQNSVIAMVNASGSVVESYEYDAYGNTKIFNASGTELTTSAIGNRYMFQGREYDSATGLYYFRARWYDPDTGRWLSKDPVGIEGGLNQYVFCDNNPVNNVDPTGNFSILIAVCAITIAVVVFAVANSIISGSSRSKKIDDAQFDKEHKKSMKEYGDLIGKVLDGTATPEEEDRLLNGDHEQKRRDNVLENAPNIIDLAEDGMKSDGIGAAGGKIMGAGVPGLPVLVK